ncbi:MAG: UbiA family prenyltransferase [Candidatus Omnitrophica bacterium]|nr:UbiA family prenyltransferase [Candidatus Omnitrophota bacterium]
MRRVKTFLQAIKFEHTLFALPFAYLGLFLGEQGLPRFRVFFWVTLAMVALRTAGMIANRLADFEFDRRNPRTQLWPVSQGLISRRWLQLLAALSLAIYFLACASLNTLCFALSPIPCLMILTYPYLKRFTWLCHIFLGAILALAPLGGWAASRGVVGLEALPLAFSVLFWVAGFDILYALQDEEFDRREGLFSIPAHFGRKAGLLLAGVFHVLAVASLVWLGQSAGLHIYYWAAMILASVVMLQEYLPGVRLWFIPNAAFSVILFFGTWLDLTLR